MATLIIVNNQICKLTEEVDTFFLRKLDNHLSYQLESAKYMPSFRGSYRNGKFTQWDGTTRLMNKKLEFNLGLLDRVKKFYKDNNRELKVIDIRPKKSQTNERNISQRLKELEKVPRDYQLNCLNAAINNDRGIFCCATGSGKTLMAAMITAHFNLPTIVYVIGKDLLYQFRQLFSDIFQEEIGIVGDGNYSFKRITICSIWTLGKCFGIKNNEILSSDEEDEEDDFDSSYKQEILKNLKRFKVHMLDECHIGSAPTITQIYKNINPERLYGFSGTPVRDDGSDLLLESILGNYIATVSASELIEKKVLVPPIIEFIDVPKKANLSGSNYQTVYKEYIVDNEERNKLIFNKAKELLNNGRQVLVLFGSIRHGQNLYKLFKEEIECEILSGKDKTEKRLEVKEKLLKGEIKCILASKIYDIGVDISSLDGLILTTSGKSSVRTLQRIGRVIRSHPGKKDAQITDFIDNTKYLLDHSRKRYKIYSKERAFVIKLPESLKDKK
jgi:superfamily II DNA or RNA helicase